MNNDQKFWVAIWSMLFISINIITIVVYNYHIKMDTIYVKNGYQKTPIVGYSYPVWRKAE